MSRRFKASPRPPGSVTLRYGETTPQQRHQRKQTRRMGKMAQVLERDGWKCRYCGAQLIRGLNATKDHIIPLSRGGADTLDNLAACCVACNQDKGNRLLEEWTPPMVITHRVVKRKEKSA